MLSRISHVSSLPRSVSCAFRMKLVVSPVQISRTIFSRQIFLQPLNYLQTRHFSTEKKDVELQDKIFTIPNILSGIRFVLAPVIGYMTIKGLFLPSLYTCAFAGALDCVDGYIARHFNQRSRLGTLLDPIADKALMVCLAIAMGYSGLIHIPVAALIIGKDVLMGLGFFGICWKHGYHKPSEMMKMIKSLEVKPSMLGKTNTVLQIGLFLCGLARPIWGIPSVQLFLPFEALVSCTTVASLVSYALTTNKALKFEDIKQVDQKDPTPKDTDNKPE